MNLQEGSLLSSDWNTPISYQENIFLIKKMLRTQISEQKGRVKHEIRAQKVRCP